MSGIKSLVKDTAIYGLSSMLGRFLNWWLVPFYMATLSNTEEFGNYTHIYAITALLLVLLTFGMETAFFRYANKNEVDSGKVYSTSLISVGTIAFGFLTLCLLFANPIASFLGYADNSSYIRIMAAVVAIDAFISIPFAYLRYQQRPIRFASIKLLFIFFNILFNIFFLVLCPYLYRNHPSSISWFYHDDYKVGYIFLSNLLANLIILLFLLPEILNRKVVFCKSTLQKMVAYALPLLTIGLIGVLNQNIDKIIYPLLISDPVEAKSQLGIYGGCFKIAVIMAMFIQAFRFAYEPFVFAEGKKENSTTIYSRAMIYFILFALVIFLGVSYYIDVFSSFLGEYYAGIHIVPIVMLGELFFGIFFNLSLWYKLTDKTQFGAYFSLVGCFVILFINILFVPKFGYIASAWAFLISNLVMMLLSYYFGQKHYPISYNLKLIFYYTLLTITFYVVGLFPVIENKFVRWGYRGVLFLIFCAIIYRKEVQHLLKRKGANIK